MPGDPLHVNEMCKGQEEIVSSYLINSNQFLVHNHLHK